MRKSFIIGIRNTTIISLAGIYILFVLSIFKFEQFANGTGLINSSRTPDWVGNIWEFSGHLKKGRNFNSNWSVAIPGHYLSNFGPCRAGRSKIVRYFCSDI